jgi:hypothetical protein
MLQICAPTSNPDSDFPIDISQHCPYIHVAAVASNSDKAVGSFDLDGQQYISILTHGGNKAIAPISCFIPDSPRYKLGKPVPANKRYATAEGFLVNATFSDSKDLKFLERFHIEVDSVIALGYHQQGASASTKGGLYLTFVSVSYNS